MSDAEQRTEYGYVQTEAMLALEGELQGQQDEIDALRMVLGALYGATHAYLNTGSDPASPTVRPLQDALANAFAALHPHQRKKA